MGAEDSGVVGLAIQLQEASLSAESFVLNRAHCFVPSTKGAASALGAASSSSGCSMPP